MKENINALETLVSNWGYPKHTIHTGPLIRREGVYKNDLRENRKTLFNVLYHFTRMLDINYICSIINQGECAEKTKLAYTDKLTKEIANKLRATYMRCLQMWNLGRLKQININYLRQQI